ncbi:unnamed protein product [Peniophora sp. CBMAI 1063]|nr:unnamed protein product [Peniophora sp. CBMAI 1063]
MLSHNTNPRALTSKDTRRFASARRTKAGAVTEGVRALMHAPPVQAADAEAHGPHGDQEAFPLENMGADAAVEAGINVQGAPADNGGARVSLVGRVAGFFGWFVRVVGGDA